MTKQALAITGILTELRNVPDGPLDMESARQASTLLKRLRRHASRHIIRTTELTGLGIDPQRRYHQQLALIPSDHTGKLSTYAGNGITVIVGSRYVSDNLRVVYAYK